MSREKHYGFSGTRHGMTDAQVRAVAKILRDGRPTHLHHGCCVGADEQVCLIAVGLGIDLVAHPPNDPRLMSGLAFNLSSTQLNAMPYLDRDRAIVDQSMHLIATPQFPEDDELSKRSGTWFTVRYARHEKQYRSVVAHDGEVFN